MARFSLIGAAGSGKTTTGVGMAKKWFESGAGPHDVAYLAFTKAAAHEAAGRISDDRLTDHQIRDQFPFFRTIHSLCYMGMSEAISSEPEGDVSIMLSSDFKRFSEESGMDGAYQVSQWEELADIYQSLSNHGRTNWDKCLTAYTLSRMTARSTADLDQARVEMSRQAIKAMDDFVPTDEYQAFVQKYDEYRGRAGKIDFTDMLEFGLRSMDPIGSRFVIVDEFQDNCPILVEICKRLFPDAEEFWMVGDDWQSIYSWSGVDASDFIREAKDSRMSILNQTYRFGKEVVDFSRKIIDRVANKIEKEVLPAPGKTHRIEATGEFKPKWGNRLILHRHVAGCQAIAAKFIDAGIPFSNERGKDPLSSRIRVSAFRTMNALKTGQPVPLSSAVQLVEEIIPSIYFDPSGERVRMIFHGAKTKIKNMSQGQRTATLASLMIDKILTPVAAHIIQQGDYTPLKYTADLEYYARCVKNGYGLDTTGAPIITTIHGSKGRDADDVTVFAEMGRKCWRDPDSEHRLAYVAATRTKGGLEICLGQNLEWAQAAYDYPL